MNQSESIKDLATALAKAQSEILGAVKDSKNGFFQSTYADLASVWDAIREPLTKNGLSVTQTTDFIEAAGTCIVTTLLHSSGQWIKGTLPIVAVKQDPQAIGSAITYSRRYALAAIVGVAQVDDDTEAAQGRNISESHEIKNVTEQAGPAKPVCFPSCEKMLVSKFNASELYCPKCKRKEPKAA